MCAVGSDLADVELAESIRKLLENSSAFHKGGIDLTRMADIKAEARVWKSIKTRAHLDGCPTNLFALIHVLQ